MGGSCNSCWQGDTRPWNFSPVLTVFPLIQKIFRCLLPVQPAIKHFSNNTFVSVPFQSAHVAMWSLEWSFHGTHLIVISLSSPFYDFHCLQIKAQTCRMAVKVPLQQKLLLLSYITLLFFLHLMFSQSRVLTVYEPSLLFCTFFLHACRFLYPEYPARSYLLENP